MYMIVRHYRAADRKSKIINTCLTLEQAQAHCSDPSTRKDGVWFDGYADQRYEIRNSNNRRVKRGMLYEEARESAARMSARNPRERYSVYPMQSF